MSYRRTIKQNGKVFHPLKENLSEMKQRKRKKESFKVGVHYKFHFSAPGVQKDAQNQRKDERNIELIQL